VRHSPRLTTARRGHRQRPTPCHLPKRQSAQGWRRTAQRPRRDKYAWRLDSTGGKKNDHNEEPNTYDSAGPITPTAAVAPGWERADQEEDEYDQENGSDCHLSTFIR
jgi:hypothetical protein